MSSLERAGLIVLASARPKWPQCVLTGVPPCLLDAHKIGRLWKFKLAEVDEWVRSGGATEGETSNDKTD